MSSQFTDGWVEEPRALKGAKVIPSELWQFLGLPDSARWEDEWRDPPAVVKPVIRLLTRVVQKKEWPNVAIRFFLSVPEGTMTPEILAALPAVKAIVRLRKMWPEMYDLLRGIAFWLVRIESSTLKTDLFSIEILLQKGAAAARRQKRKDVPPFHVCDINQQWCPFSAIERLFESFSSWEWTRKDMARRALLKKLDRAASRDPKIGEAYQWDYWLGQALAPIYGQIVKYLVRKQREYELPIFVHGRDAEIVYFLLKDRGVDVRYGITSRPLTSEGYGSVLPYHKRVVPQEAIHYDTGFAGSVPKWFASKGWSIPKTFLASRDPLRAGPNVRQIPKLEELGSKFVTLYGTKGLEGNDYDSALRRVVLTYMEHQPQRLEKIEKKEFDLSYSDGAPHFWARLAGVRDGIKALNSHFRVEIGERLAVASLGQHPLLQEKISTDNNDLDVVF